MHIAVLPPSRDVRSAAVDLDPPDPDAPLAGATPAAAEDGHARGCGCTEAPFVAWQLCSE